MSTRAKAKAVPIHDDYLDLVKRFPLARIRDDEHLKAAHSIIDELSIIGEDHLTPGEMEYLLALGDLTTVYEQDDLDEMLKDITGLDVLKHLMEDHDLTASDIGRIIGQRELGSKVLRGERRISRAHAQALGKRFAVAPEVFLR